MKNVLTVLDVLERIAMGEKIKPFHIGNKFITYYFEENEDLLMGKKEFSDEPQFVNWHIYKDWLNKEVTFVEEEE